jgi:hypothetical protein
MTQPKLFSLPWGGNNLTCLRLLVEKLVEQALELVDLPASEILISTLNI